jgi:hypothetical protein
MNLLELTSNPLSLRDWISDSEKEQFFMASKFSEHLVGALSRNRVKELFLTLLVYAFFSSVFVFADKNTELWNSSIVSASLALAFTVISMIQIVIFMRVSAFSKKTNRLIRQVQGLREDNNDLHLESLSSSEEILINVEVLRSLLNSLNLQKLDD